MLASNVELLLLKYLHELEERKIFFIALNVLEGLSFKKRELRSISIVEKENFKASILDYNKVCKKLTQVVEWYMNLFIVFPIGRH